jgi:predicted HTH domain antitoxin
MIISIPDEVLDHTKLSPSELKIELAAYLYKKQRLSIGKARRTTGLGLIEFQKELAKCNIYPHLTIDDVNTDLKNLRKL